MESEGSCGGTGPPALEGTVAALSNSGTDTESLSTRLQIEKLLDCHVKRIDSEYTEREPQENHQYVKQKTNENSMNDLMTATNSDAIKKSSNRDEERMDIDQENAVDALFRQKIDSEVITKKNSLTTSVAYNHVGQAGFDRVGSRDHSENVMRGIGEDGKVDEPPAGKNGALAHAISIKDHLTVDDSKNGAICSSISESLNGLCKIRLEGKTTNTSNKYSTDMLAISDMTQRTENTNEGLSMDVNIEQTDGSALSGSPEHESGVTEVESADNGKLSVSAELKSTTNGKKSADPADLHSANTDPGATDIAEVEGFGICGLSGMGATEGGCKKTKKNAAAEEKGVSAEADTAKIGIFTEECENNRETRAETSKSEALAFAMVPANIIETRQGTSSSAANSESQFIGAAVNAADETAPLRNAVEATGHSSRHHASDTFGASGVTPSSKEPSFLESLSEEERRTRTRHIPAVDGFRRLHKSEIKKDLKSAKRLICSVVDAEEAADDLASAAADNGDSASLTGMEESDDDTSCERAGVSFCPFVTPETSLNCNTVAVGLDCCRETSTSKRSRIETAFATENQANASHRFPHIVESVTAFSPPRPPESCALVKKQRLMRWERNPNQVEVDLANYKKTVVRTRKELHLTEQERERVENVGGTLRSHFLHHLRILREESCAVNSEISRLHGMCADQAGLMSTRTRSKGVNTVRDVVPILRTKGTKLHSLGVFFEARGTVSLACENPPVFGDYDAPGEGCQRSKSCCLVPGDHVATAYGKGVITDILGDCLLDTNISKPYLDHEDVGKRRSPSSHAEASPRVKGQPLQIESFASKSPILIDVLPPRICVNLPYGRAYIVLNDAVLLDESFSYSDKKLAARWKAMLKSSNFKCDYFSEYTRAKVMAKEGYLVPQGDAVSLDDHMGLLRPENSVNRMSSSSSQGEDDSLHMGDAKLRIDHDEKDRNGSQEQESQTESSEAEAGHDELDSSMSVQSDHKRVLPYGGGMLPTTPGCAGRLAHVSTRKIQAALDSVLNNSVGILGKPSNPSVPSRIQEWEKQRQALYEAKAKVLTLRNQLYRQRRARIVNERGYSAAQERADRVRLLLNEMKADLSSLKIRLNEELDELGIGREKARNILASYTRDQKRNDEGHIFEGDDTKIS